jgi:hypothetical protein
MMRHIWNLFARARSLWLAWVNTILLRGMSFWLAKVPQSCTWSLRKLLNLRLKARKFLKFKVGNGQNVHLWPDWWRE